MEIEVEVEVVIAMDGRDNKRLHEVVMIEVIKEASCAFSCTRSNAD